jgi:hypothetical protein
MLTTCLRMRLQMPHKFGSAGAPSWNMRPVSDDLTVAQIVKQWTQSGTDSGTTPVIN